MSKFLITCICAVFVSLPAIGQQDTQQGNVQITPMQNTPVYHVTVVSRSIEAVNYRQLSGSTKVDFRGTSLLPDASGEAKIDGKRGKINVDAKLEHLKKPSSFGPEYLTYVLWAITPEGRPSNLGEIIPNDDGKAELNVTTPLQAFGLMVTAEPYFAVTQPSDVTVAENVVLRKTEGWLQYVNTKFEALQRGAYTVSIPAAELPASKPSKHVPLELLEARNAVAIAKATGAQQYAPDSLAKAQDFLNRGEMYSEQKQNDKAIATVARGATESAEDARLLTIRRREQQETAERQRAADEQARLARERAQAEADRAAQAQATAAQNEQQRLAAEQAKADADRARAEAEQAADRARQEREQAEAARQAALQQQQQAQQQAEQARLTAQQAEQQKEQLRTQLQQQLNQVFQTRETARGLIVNMPDVLFDFNKSTLKPDARIRLAKVAGIILAHPDLHIQSEGFTDSIGSDEYNLDLSRRRAAAVRDFLVSQGVQPGSIETQGYGKSDPIASNETAQGRALNRRVDLVVSGAAIGAATAPPSPGGNAAPTGGITGSATSATQSTTTTGTSTGTVAAPTAPPPTNTQPTTNPPQQ